MRKLLPVPGVSNTQTWYIGLWQDLINTVHVGNAYLDPWVTYLYDRNERSITFEVVAHATPSVFIHGYIFSLDGEPVTGVLQLGSDEEAERHRKGMVAIRNRHSDRELLNPAREILHELEKLLRVFPRPGGVMQPTDSILVSR